MNSLPSPIVPESPRFASAGELLEWLPGAASPSLVIEALSMIPPEERHGLAARQVAELSPCWSPELVRTLFRSSDRTAPLMAENPALQGEESVRTLLDCCAPSRVSPPNLPFGLHVSSPYYRAALTLLKRGLITFAHPAVEQVRETFRTTPFIPWAREWVQNDPVRRFSLLEEALENSEREPGHFWHADACVWIVAELLRWKARGAERERHWGKLLAMSPSRVARVLDMEGVVESLSQTEVAELLVSEHSVLRLRAITYHARYRESFRMEESGAPAAERARETAAPVSRERPLPPSLGMPSVGPAPQPVSQPTPAVRRRR